MDENLRRGDDFKHAAKSVTKYKGCVRLYKCRVCGLEFSVEAKLPPNNIILSSLGGNHLVEQHDCNPFTIGLADLVGVRAIVHQENS